MITSPNRQPMRVQSLPATLLSSELFCIVECGVELLVFVSSFTSSALQQSKVHLTWDETDPKRLQTTMRK